MIISGIAQKGEGRAAKIGFPTINIPFEDPSLGGVYAAKVTVRGKEYGAAVYANVNRHILEAHLFQFSDEVYGEEISITLGEKIRDRMDFPDDESAKRQIAQDVEKARRLCIS